MSRTILGVAVFVGLFAFFMWLGVTVPARDAPNDMHRLPGITLGILGVGAVFGFVSLVDGWWHK